MQGSAASTQADAGVSPRRPGSVLGVCSLRGGDPRAERRRFPRVSRNARRRVGALNVDLGLGGVPAGARFERATSEARARRDRKAMR